MSKPDHRQKEVILESLSVNPFHVWSDWHGTESEAVVTFETMQHNLWNAWRSQCVSHEGETELVKTEDGMYRVEGETERNVDPEKFEAENIDTPGIYRDGTYYDEEDSVDEGYTIIVPYNFLSPELCQEWIQKLNKKYDRNFKLNIEEEQKPPVKQLRRIKGFLEDGKLKQKLEEAIEADKENNNNRD